MAILDKLLSTASERSMEAVILEPGHPPAMLRTGVAHPASRFPLDASTIAKLVAEVAPDGRPDPTVQFEYRIGERTFRFVARGAEGGWIARTAPSAAVPTAGEPGAAPALPVSAGARGSRSLPPVEDLLRQLLDRGGSDLHLSSGQAPRMRVHGDLLPLDEYAPPAPEPLKQILLSLTPQRNRDEFEGSGDTDFALELAGRARFRANLFRDRGGIGAVFRQIPSKIPSADELGLPPAIRKLSDLSRGLVLVTGPTGSGKSTTLAAVIDLINGCRNDHIITIEDPVEFVHPSKRCLVHHREVGEHTGSFKRALRAALREDPDIVLVGEMRDLETTAIAIETAETGHLVFGTLHTTTAASTIDRLIDQYPSGQQAQVRLMLAVSLRAVVAQTLLKKVGGGRIAAFEIMICTPAISSMVREGKTFQIPSAMQTGRKLGMMLLNDSLARLVEDGLVDPREAYLKAVDKEDLVNRLRGLNVDLGCLEASAA